jgi:hypothetical protein
MPLAFIYIQFCAFAQKSKKNEPRKIPSHFHHIQKLQALLCHSIQNITPYSPEINSPSSNLQTPMLLHRENQPSLWFSAMALSRYTVYLHHPISLPSSRPSGIRIQSARAASSHSPDRAHRYYNPGGTLFSRPLPPATADQAGRTHVL